jgi:hypothetical protein
MDVADAVASADVVARCDARNDGDNYLDDDDRHDEQSGGPGDAVASGDGVVLRVDEAASADVAAAVPLRKKPERGRRR